MSGRSTGTLQLSLIHILDQSRSQRVDGVGLGLSLSREIIRAHGGDLTLEDIHDKFTRFVVELPISKLS